VLHTTTIIPTKNGVSFVHMPQSIVDVWVKKEVSPSQLQRAGSILLYRIKVGVTSNASRPADTVTMVDAMPEGMSLVALVEDPDERGMH